MMERSMQDSGQGRDLAPGSDHLSNPSPEPRSPGKPDPLFALLAVNGAWGAALGVAFVIGAVALDIGHLRQLIGFTSDGVIALALLLGGSIITFGSVAMGSAIMMIGTKDRDPDDKGRRHAVPLALVPVRVASSAGKQRKAH
jgi:hypothetical protein